MSSSKALSHAFKKRRSNLYHMRKNARLYRATRDKEFLRLAKVRRGLANEWWADIMRMLKGGVP